MDRPDKEPETVVFQSGNSLAIRLLGDCKLPKGTRVREYRDGKKIVLEPVEQEEGWPQEFLDLFGSVPGGLPRPTPEYVQRNPFDGWSEAVGKKDRKRARRKK